MRFAMQPNGFHEKASFVKPTWAALTVLEEP